MNKRGIRFWWGRKSPAEQRILINNVFVNIDKFASKSEDLKNRTSIRGRGVRLQQRGGKVATPFGSGGGAGRGDKVTFSSIFC